MAVKVMIPTPLRQYAGKQDSIELEAKTVGEALAGLTSQYSELRRHLYNDDGKIRSFVNIYLNDEDIRYLSKEQTPLNDRDVLSIVPSIAGGMALDVLAGRGRRAGSIHPSALRCICR
ncbi:MAG TPA: MoaD/ThiS family protein [Terriglobia bacterium]|nr:MoaD/ThiS family protein [Terriglobia bacterium]